MAHNDPTLYELKRRQISPLRVYRVARGLTQDELAMKAGVGRNTVVRTEHGETRPRGATLTMLAAALDVSPDALLSPNGHTPG